MTHKASDKEQPESVNDKKESLSFGHMILTVLAAAIGVQNRKNLEKDFGQSSPWPYIFAGIIFTVLFLATLIFVAKLALSDVN